MIHRCVDCLLKAIAAIVALAAIVGSAGWVYLRRSLPQIVTG